MKKILLLSAIVFNSFFTFSQAEEDENDNKLNGIRFGYQHSNLLNNDEDAANNLDRFYIGFTRQKKLSPLFRLETGLEYMIAGAMITEDSKLELHYITIPLQAHLKIGPFLGTAGLNALFKVAQKMTFGGTKIEVTDENKATFMDCTADVGLGFKILMITLEARYYYGLVDIKDGWHNNYYQLGLKVSF
ncbi:MAG: outer membrane beta-barrel protein [Bacteroidia bacterium]